jgi:type III restriction enzyme
MEARKIPLVILVRARFQLLKALAGKVREYHAKASLSIYQTMLFDKTTTAQTTYDYSFQFDPKSYPTNSFYQGRYRFNKHYYGEKIGAFDSEDEFFCAQVIDQCPEVKTWVRNLVHESWGFRLPLSNGYYFYPDFVAMLNDGRIFVVEYKVTHLFEGAQEKKNIGELWEENSNGRALFLMAVKSDAQRQDVYKQIEDKTKA